MQPSHKNATFFVAVFSIENSAVNVFLPEGIHNIRLKHNYAHSFRFCTNMASMMSRIKIKTINILEKNDTKSQIQCLGALRSKKSNLLSSMFVSSGLILWLVKVVSEAFKGIEFFGKTST